MKPLFIAEDIREAQTLPADFYRNPDRFEAVAERVLARTWQYAGDTAVAGAPGAVHPFTLLPGVLDEPLLWTVDREGRRHCLSNVCTHRGKLVVEQDGVHRQLTCGYHGRCFELDGAFKRMPAFGDVAGFPSPADHLTRVPFAEWMKLLFVALDPARPFEEMVRPMRERLAFLPLDELIYDETGSRDYHLAAHWALYCDNYLEGFHIPFVHPALNQALDVAQYRYELFPYCNLQVGIAGDGEPHFDPPPGHPDHGQPIYAYYFFLFPNLMFNFYPWGLSLNVVEPLDHRRTRVRFRTYRFPDTPYDYTVHQLDKTELEDEAVVESCQAGVRSRFYDRGRYSPAMEPCVHHFHRLLAGFVNR